MNTKDNEKTDGAVDLARFLRLPVYFFDLDPVLERSQSPLAHDREKLQILCEQQLAAITAKDSIVHAATGFYLIVQSATGEAASALAERLNVALARLLGGPEAQDQKEFEPMYRRVQAPGMDAPVEKVEAAQVLPSAANEDSQPIERTPRDAYAELAMRGVFPGQNVELVFRPVHDLVRGRATTFFCTPAFCVAGAPVITGYRAFEGISPRELPFLDRAILAHALKFARRLGEAGVYTAVGAPVSFESLVWSRGREIYREALRAAGVPDYPFAVLIIRDVPAGITASRLAEIVGAIRPLAKRVFVHLPEHETAALASGHLGADGFILSLPSRQTPQQTERSAQWLAKMSEAQTALSCVDQIENDSSLEIVKAAGIRFGQGAAFGSAEFKGSTVPIDVEAFMRAAQRAGQAALSRNVHRLGQKRESRALHRVN
jgi:hypothetical protein